MTDQVLGSSFRDPSGFLYCQDGILYRQVNQAYAPDLDKLSESGLYERLVNLGLLIPHETANVSAPRPELCYRVIRPEPLAFISYPYEWCFSQLKDAALATLEIEKQALECGMSLKDASAYNIQFRDGRPLLIDTLSFETYREGEPWVAYRQFCQHFLAPLALMAYVDVRLGQLMRIHIDGVPLDLASALLPLKTHLRFSLQSHIHLHAKSQKRHAGEALDRSRLRPVSAFAFRALIDSLESAVRGLEWNPGGTDWADYYQFTNYEQAAFASKQDIVSSLLDRVSPKTVWDLGANTGRFSQIASEKGCQTLAFDIDPSAVEACYRRVRDEELSGLLPLLSDLTNPTPSQGWAHDERLSLAGRGPTDCVMALALIHHLAISNNVPLPMVAQYFGQLGDHLIIEFVPKGDSQVDKLLSTREDIFTDYTTEGFESAFGAVYEIVDRVPVQDSKRSLYLLEKKVRG